MPHVTTHYRVYVAAGHHRQPRAGSTWIEPNPQSDAEVVPGTTITPYAPPHLAYGQGGQDLVGTFLFWSATDGSDGQTTTSQTLHQTVGANPMTLTAWYLPPGGPGGDGGPGYLLDAFSDALGDFVDDTFVTVAGDPAKTTQANVVGDISTVSAESLHAADAIHTGETFERWIAVAAPGQTQPTASGADVTLAAGTSGVAIATYHRAHLSLPKVHEPAQGLVILGGVAVDGGGYVFPIGNPGGGGPVGPWGPFLERSARAAVVGSLGARMHGGADIARHAADEAMAAAKQLGAQLER